MKDQHKRIPTDYIDPLKREDFTSFLKSLTDELNKNIHFISITLPVAAIDPLAVLEMQDSSQETFYWEHPQEQTAIAAFGKVQQLRATGSARFDEISRQFEEIRSKTLSYTAVRHPMAGPLFAGGYSFNDYNIGTPWNRFGAARFFLPDWSLVRDKDHHLLTLTLRRDERRPDEIYDEVLERLTYFIMLASRGESHAESQMGSQAEGHAESRFRADITQPSDTSITEDASRPRQEILCDLGSVSERERWIRNVEVSRDRIRKGHFDKIVIARKLPVSVRNTIEPAKLSFTLRDRFPDCTTFYFQPETKQGEEPIRFIGATPETLIKFSGDRITTEGLAGSIQRGSSALEDLSLERQLLQSKKDREEHDFVVQSIRKSLEKLTKKVIYPRKPMVKKLPHVQHLHTPMQAKLQKNATIHSIVRELHPTPAVGGFPRQEANRHIEEIEQLERGWYASPVGWFNASGEGHFVVAIRSALLERNLATLYAGCGIVEDSDPEAEWRETIMKFSTLMDALVVQTK